jgi:hypothetical protein
LNLIDFFVLFQFLANPATTGSVMSAHASLAPRVTTSRSGARPGTCSTKHEFSDFMYIYVHICKIFSLIYVKHFTNLWTIKPTKIVHIFCKSHLVNFTTIHTKFWLKKVAKKLEIPSEATSFHRCLCTLTAVGHARTTRPPIHRDQPRHWIAKVSQDLFT